MVSHFIYKCTLFLACRWRHFFSMFARVHRSRDVSFLCIFTLPFPICFLEFWKRQSWTVLKIAIQLSDHLLATRKAFKSKTPNKIDNAQSIGTKTCISKARGKLHGRTSQQRCSLRRPRWMQAETRTRRLLEVRRRAAAGGLERAVWELSRQAWPSD